MFLFVVLRISVLRSHGLLKQRPERNTVLAEKTPRNTDYQNFGGHHPPVIEGGIRCAADRWNVPGASYHHFHIL